MSAEQGSFFRRMMHQLSPLISVLLFAVALYVLHRALSGHHYSEIIAQLEELPRRNVVWAGALSVLSYFALTSYEVLALLYVRRPLSYPRIAFASFIGYTFSNNLGFSLISGAPIRFRLYSGWGLSALEIANIVAFTGLTFAIGFIGVAGFTFLVEPVAIPESLHIPLVHSVQPLGVLFVVIALGYVALNLIGRQQFQIREWEIRLPGWKMALLQFVVSALDWAVAGGVLWALFPPTAPLSYGELMGVFMLAQTAGLVSNVPGGLGVFETVMLVTLQSKFPAPEILGTLMAYRTIYYLGPFVLALVMLAGHEIFERREHIVRVARYVKPWVPGLVPQVLAFTTFVGGAILLYSGALPADRHRFWFLRALPLPVIELSHFLGSVIGAVLLILARGLQRRLDAAYYCACLLLGLGIVTAVLKGFDYEEAIALGLMLIALLPCHQHFYRKSALLQEPFTPSWIAAMILVFVGMLWLGMFTYKHVEYTDQLWWNFSLHSHDQAGDASRFLRASVGAICAMLVFAIAYLARPATPEPNLPGPEDLDRAWEVVRKSPATYANLALLGDKTLLFSESGKAFLMYAIERRSWVALGDPVGDPADRTELLWRFREMCDHHEGWPVFYQVQPTNLPLYIDLGLALLKLGEEARVALPTFTLEGRAHKGLRHGYNRGLQAGLTFEIAPVEQVPALMPRLRQVSDAWLGEKHTREKRFSLGFFDEDYLRRFPMALIRRDDQIIGFANMWCGADKEELSIDLMRYLPEAGHDAMEFLFIQLMLWGKTEGYRWFNLGMAPLAGLDDSEPARIWNKVGALIFRHGEHFYNFQGLRQYKEKFDPVWEPRYLACPGGLALPTILTHLATLIAGGVRGIVRK